MDRAGGQKDYVSDARLKMVQTKLASSAVDFARKRGAIEATLQACIDHAAGLCGKDDPGLGFAEIERGEPRSLLVVGMDLNRQHLTGIEKLEKERKARLG